MTSAAAMAGSSCTHCGYGPSQSFRPDPISASTSFKLDTNPPLSQTHFRHAIVPRRSTAYRSGRNRKAVSMEFGGNMIRPKIAGPREFVSGGQMLQRLRKQLFEAISNEDYSEAARVRDFINIIMSQDPVLSTREALEQAVTEERYDDAAKLRDELKELSPPEQEVLPLSEELANSSDRLTQNIRVRVKSGYVAERSNPSLEQYFFAYRIRISNEGSRTVQLQRRHWVISDATGRTEHVKGPGVIGEQPVLRAGAEFEYTSACPLKTPAGKMEGEYHMIHVDSDDPAPFAVAIGPFALRAEDEEENPVGFQ